MDGVKMVNELLGVPEDRVKYITDWVENLIFSTSYDFTEIPTKIIEEFKDPNELFMATMLFVRIHDVVNSKVYKE